MADQLKFTIRLPQPGAADVVERTLSITQVAPGDDPDAEPNEQTETFPGFTTTAEVIATQDSQVSLSLVDVDDADNESEPSVFEFVATDTVAPPQPGLMGVTKVEEIFPPDDQNDQPEEPQEENV